MNHAEKRRPAPRSAILLLLALLSTGGVSIGGDRSEVSAEEAPAESYFTRETIARGKEYSAERLGFYLGHLALDLAFWTFLLVSGLAGKIAGRLSRGTGGRFGLQSLRFFALVLLLERLVSYPLALASGFFHRRSWGLLHQGLISWHGDWALVTLGSIAIIAPLAAVAYVLLRRAPRLWWISAGAIFGSAIVFAMYLYPVVIAPLFNTFTPLEAGPLRERLLGLAEEAGLEVDEVYVMDASRRSTHTNAYVAGLGATKRIVLYDTLLEDHTAEEVASVFAHELGHWKEGHLWKGMVLAVSGTFLMTFLLQRVLVLWARRRWFGVSEPWSLGGAPIAALFIIAAGTLTQPVENAISRRFERQADDEELRLLERPDLFISSMEKLARANLADVEPHPVKKWFLYSHPPIMERIRRALAEEKHRSKERTDSEP